MTNAVTFPVGLCGDGSTVTDDADASTGLANGGHAKRFVPALAQTVIMAQTAKTQADAATVQAGLATGAVTTTQALFNRIYLGGI
jgi:hypothetical protein